MGSLLRTKDSLSLTKMQDTLSILKNEERLVPFIRRLSSDWDFLRGQLLDLSVDDSLFLSSWCRKVEALLKDDDDDVNNNLGQSNPPQDNPPTSSSDEEDDDLDSVSTTTEENTTEVVNNSLNNGLWKMPSFEFKFHNDQKTLEEEKEESKIKKMPTPSNNNNNNEIPTPLTKSPRPSKEMERLERLLNMTKSLENAKKEEKAQEQPTKPNQLSPGESCKIISSNPNNKPDQDKKTLVQSSKSAFGIVVNHHKESKSKPNQLQHLPPPVPTKPSRPSLSTTKGSSTSSRLKSPSRKNTVTLTLEDFNALTTGTSSSTLNNPRGRSACRTKRYNAIKRYASSLPDKDRSSNTKSPVAFDINSFLCHNQGQIIDFNSILNPHHGGRSAQCKSPSPNRSSSNRHSSYHPLPPPIDLNTLAYNAAYNAAFNTHLMFSRPTSPINLGQCSGESGESPFTSDPPFCHSCASKTFPRGGKIHQPHPQHPLCCNLEKGSLLGLDYEDRLLRLESDKETLHLQVSCLSDQIEAQTDKIKDLEKLLEDKRNVLENTEEQLGRELVTRSSLETQKLEMLTELSSLRLKQASLERENFELKEKYGGSTKLWDKPPPPSSSFIRSASPYHLSGEGQRIRLQGSNSVEREIIMMNRTKTPPIPSSNNGGGYRRLDQPTSTSSSSYGTIPRRQFPNSQEINSTNSHSSGNLYSNHNGDKVDNKLSLLPLPPPLPTPNKENNSKKGRGILPKLLGKLRRTNSGGLDGTDSIAPAEGPQQPFQPFIRGSGIRATAQPRLGWAPNNKGTTTNNQITQIKMPEGHPRSWDQDRVIQWLNYLGLSTHPPTEIKRWLKSGQQLLQANSHELEKELGIKNPLHKKKLILALESFKQDSSNNVESSFLDKLDHSWVIRWLDDIGLPQYKETFSEGKVDGRVLNYITQEDLVALKVTSVLHHASIKRGIQLLRIHNFHPDCLIRRGGPSPTLPQQENNKNTNGSISSDINNMMNEGNCNSLTVSSWTNHRVMEWLRAIDLAEYAPNLRGSGVHGALIMFEPRFTTELMATLLSIPSSKTLLRRHLSIQISELLGGRIMGEKRNAELGEDYIPINPTTKVKIVKKPIQFPLRKPKRITTAQDYANEELLCPIIFNLPQPSKTQLSSSLSLTSQGFGSQQDDDDKVVQDEDKNGKVSNI